MPSVHEDADHTWISRKPLATDHEDSRIRSTFLLVLLAFTTLSYLVVYGKEVFERTQAQRLPTTTLSLKESLSLTSALDPPLNEHELSRHIRRRSLVSVITYLQQREKEREEEHRCTCACRTKILIFFSFLSFE